MPKIPFRFLSGFRDGSSLPLLLRFTVFQDALMLDAPIPEEIDTENVRGGKSWRGTCLCPLRLEYCGRFELSEMDYEHTPGLPMQSR